MEFFKYCNFYYIAFKVGLFFYWVFVVSYGFFCFYWKQEAEEERVEARKKTMDAASEMLKVEVKKATPVKQ